MAKSAKTLYEKTIKKGFEINNSSKALAYFIFRELIEDVHAKYDISQDEMRELNRRAVNRAALFLQLMNDEAAFASLVMLLNLEATGWDNPIETDDTRGFKDLAMRAADELRSTLPKPKASEA
jgi:hypothetical protein